MAKPTIASLAPAEAIAFFRKKGLATSYNWKDVWQEEHAIAFTVAKAMRIDILEDIREAVDGALAKGITFSEFQKNLAPVLQAKGWWGKRDMVDPKTGETISAQLGSTRRLRTIFDTNLRMARSAGRWEQIQRVKATRPYLRYMAVLDGRTRDTHRRWHGTVLPVDHAFWKTHYPPNGWHCRCIIQQLSERDLNRYGYEVSNGPTIDPRPWTNNRTGEILQVPTGISPGFAYNVGEARLRAFTPPPAGGGTPVSFAPDIQGRVDLPPLPSPRSAPSSRLLADDLSEGDYIDRFLGEFDKPVFTDKAGEDVIITRALFGKNNSNQKPKKRDRERFLLLAVDTIKDPDEIWWFWEESRAEPGKWFLRRRYIARWSVQGEQRSGTTVFDWGQNGWSGVTAFAPESFDLRRQENYLNNQRSGTLAYRRK